MAQMFLGAVAEDGEGTGGASGRLGSGDDARYFVRCLVEIAGKSSLRDSQTHLWTYGIEVPTQKVFE
jgi:hypothetical protein